MTNLSAALADWSRLLGADNITIKNENIKKLEKTTFPTKQKVLAIINPKSSKEVKRCIHIANKHQVALYPISKGRNWGYGSAVPVEDSVIIDLSKMNKILDYHEKLAYVTVEPGVTFKKLHEYLRNKNSSLMMPRMGGGSEASLIGHVLERGIGKGILGNRANFVCDLEIVLPQGDIIYSGNTNFGSSKLGVISRESLGPDITGIFSQSNLGIVTKMTLWLVPKPKYSQTLVFYFNDDKKLIKVIDVLRTLRLENTIGGNFLLSNFFRQLTCLQQYPWKETKNRTPLTNLLTINRLKIKWNIAGQWRGAVTMSASDNKAQIIGQSIRIKSLLSKLCKTVIVEDKKVGDDTPSDLPIRSLYWRKKTPIPKKIDPDKDGCGGIWISPVVPFDGKEVLMVVKMMTRIMLKYQYEPNLGINFVTERKIYITGAIIYDREVSGEDKKAIACHDEIYNELVKKGNIPYRLNIHSMAKMPKPSKSYANFIKKLKMALDPNDILAPGRYDFRKYW